MAKKDFDQYVLKITKQYNEFKEILEQVSKEAQQGITSIDFVDKLEEQIIPLKQNYERVMFIKFLLDQPTRKKKVDKYNKTINKKLQSLDINNNLENTLNENNNIMEGLKKK